MTSGDPRPIQMDGFVHTAEGYAKSCAASGSCSGGSSRITAGQRAMGYYDQGFLNYYYYMASQFALSDRWFSPVSSKTVGQSHCHDDRRDNAGAGARRAMTSCRS